MVVDAISCPKCQAAMRSVERSGVVIDRCTECGGIFLDRGELQRLMDAESSHNDNRESRGNKDDDERNRYGRRRGGGGFLSGMFGGEDD